MKRITQFILCIVLAVSAYGQGVGGNSVPRTVSGISAALDLISSTQGTVFYRGASGWEALPPGTSGQLFSTQGAAANPIWVTATGGAGDVNGPTLGTATDNAIVRFDGTGGKTVQNSAVTIADTTGAMTWATGQAATLTGGSSGASLVLESGTTGVATIAAAAGGLRGLVIGAASSSDGFPLRLLLDSNGAATIDHTNANAGASALARFSLASSAGTSSLTAYSAAHSVWPGSTLLTAPGAGGLSILATSAGGPIDFYTNSSQAARITSTRNLLIGTTSETGLSGSGNLKTAGGGLFGGSVTIFGTSNVLTLQKTGGAAALSLGDETNTYSLLESINAGGLTIYTGNGTLTSRMTIGATGQVGITSTATATASSAGGGALQVGSNVGLSGNAGGTSYFGGVLSVSAASGDTLTLSKGTGPSIKFQKTDATAQAWSLSGEGSYFRVYDITAGTAPLSIASSTGVAIFAGAVSVSGTTATWTSGTGSPESVKTAPVGSLYTRTDGGASTTLYVKESGAGNTGWVAK